MRCWNWAVALETATNWVVWRFDFAIWVVLAMPEENASG